MTLYVPIGPPGCGKSSLGKKMVQHGIITSDAIVSSDAIRELVSGDPMNQDCTPVAFRIVDLILEYRLKNNLHVYMDATNLTAKPRSLMLDKALGYKQNIVIYLTSLTEDQILERNSSDHRVKNGTVVPDHAMERMFQRMKDARTLFGVDRPEWMPYSVASMEDAHKMLDFRWPKFEV